MRRLALAAALALAACGPAPASETQVTIAAGGGPQFFTAELALTEDQITRGLMFRKDLPADRGMLFVYDAEQPLNFWMKNTYLPLDLIFVAADGRIVHIAQGQPLSEAIIPSVHPAKGVLEINAGEAARRGIAVGDRLSAPPYFP